MKKHIPALLGASLLLSACSTLVNLSITNNTNGDISGVVSIYDDDTHSKKKEINVGNIPKGRHGTITFEIDHGDSFEVTGTSGQTNTTIAASSKITVGKFPDPLNKKILLNIIFIKQIKVLLMIIKLMKVKKLHEKKSI